MRRSPVFPYRSPGNTAEPAFVESPLLGNMGYVIRSVFTHDELLQ